MYARVAVLTERGALSQTYTYEIPESERDAPIGGCVLVPFQTQVRLGYLVEKMPEADVPRTRRVLGRCPSADVGQERVDLAEWMASRWFTSVGACLRMMLPPAVRGKIIRKVAAVDAADGDPLRGYPADLLALLRDSGPLTIQAVNRRFGRDRAQRALSNLRKAGLLREEAEFSLAAGAPRSRLLYSIAPDARLEEWLEKNARRKPRQADIVRALASGDAPMSLSDLGSGNSARASLKALEAEGVVAITTGTVDRRAREVRPAYAVYRLSAQQAAAVDEVNRCIDAAEYHEVLLFGVTASGKTEVYLRLIRRVLESGRGALVLMPEIALTVHAVAQYRAQFAEELAVLHSRLSVGERADEWRRVESGEARVVLGPRSAAFAPLKDPGLIIIDEEHEPAFKQESDPRYHAREVCRRICEREGIPLVLGSATPSIESYHSAINGGAHICELPSRIDRRPMPEVEIVDMSEIAREGELTVLSPRLREELTLLAQSNGQAILFLNRRAYGTFVMCRECGYVADCPNCAVAAKFHRVDYSIRCHHCNWKKIAPVICPQCQGTKIRSFGVGTQRVEEELEDLLPESRVLRMDRDTTSRKDALVSIIDDFREHRADILIGTQMVAKGLDFPDVLLVGIVNADSGLHMPDFRASERSFQLLTQVAGRAGRGERPGKVLLQTFRPEHYAIRAAAEHNYRSFYEEEMEARREMGWPPAGSVARVVAQAETLRECEEQISKAMDALRKTAGPIDLIGPAPAPVERLKGRWRWHILLRAPERKSIFRALEDAGARSWGDGLIVDIDPISLL